MKPFTYGGRLADYARRHGEGPALSPLIVRPSRSEQCAAAAAWCANTLFAAIAFAVVVGLIRTHEAPYVLFAYPFIMGAWLARGARTRKERTP